MNVQFRRRPQGPCAGLVGEHLERMFLTIVWGEGVPGQPYFIHCHQLCLQPWDIGRFLQSKNL